MVFQVIFDFMSAEEDVGAETGPSFVKTNRKFFILVFCHQVTHLVIQSIAILAVLSSIYRDMAFNENLMRNGQVQIFERNAQVLESIFGDRWRRNLCRVSTEQVTFFVGTVAWGILYVVNLVHFCLYKNFRVRVVWTGFFHFLVLGMQCTLLSFIFTSYFKINEDLKRVTEKLRTYYNTPSGRRRGAESGHVNSLMEHGQPVFFYCLDGNPSEDLQRRLHGMNLCPAEAQKIFALTIIWIDVFLTLGCIITVILWHYSALEVAEIGAERIRKSSAEDDSSVSSEDLGFSGSIREAPEYADDFSPIDRSRHTVRDKSVFFAASSQPPPRFSSLEDPEPGEESSKPKKEPGESSKQHTKKVVSMAPQSPGL